MLRTTNCLTLFLALIFAVFSANPVKANHIAGADFTYKALGGDTFLITLTVYRNCAGAALSNTSITVTPDCGVSSTTVNTSLSNGEDVTPVCSKQCTKCSDPNCSFGYGFEKYELTGKAILSGSCCKWTASWGQCCRNSKITTGASGKDFYTEIFINKCARPGNGSPVFSAASPLIIAKDLCFSRLIGAYLPSGLNTGGDSLVYKMAEPLSTQGTAIPYASGYTYKEPLIYKGYPNANLDFNPPQCQGFHFDSLTGGLSFKATQEDVTTMAITVEQWGKDTAGKMQLLGRVRRDFDMAIITTPDNRAPMISGVNGTSGNTYYFAPGRSSCFTIASFDPDSGDTLKLSWDKSITGASMSFTNDKWPKGTFCWTPDSNAKPGKYSMSVKVTDGACPLPALTERVFTIIVDTVLADFSIPDSICPSVALKPLNRSYYKTSKPGYLWTFGDGDSSTDENPSHLYKASGNYTVSLFTLINGKLSSSIQKRLMVYSRLQPSILLTNSGYCAGSGLYVFSANVKKPKGTLHYAWDFGNGVTSTNATDTIIYAKNGIYNVKLTVRDSDCEATANYTVKLENKAFFSLTSDSVQCLRGNYFTFNVPNTTGKFSWDFGDGTSSSLANPAKTYSSKGYYTIRLITESANGCKDTFSKAVRVKGVEANFTVYPIEGCPGDRISLSNTSQSDSGTQYSWNIDGKQTHGGKDTSVSFSAPGFYRIILTASIGKCYVQKDVFVRITMPTVTLEGPDMWPAAEMAIYSARTENGNQLNWILPPSASVIDSSDISNIKLSFNDTGFVKLGAEAVNTYGCKATSYKTIHIVKYTSITPAEDWQMSKVYPVPSSDKVFLDISSKTMQEVNLKLVNVNGAVVYEKQLNLSAGPQQKEISMEKLPAGIYLLQLQSDKGYRYCSVVKY